MDKEFKRALSDLVRSARPEWKDLNDDEVQEKVHEAFMKKMKKTKLDRPLHYGANGRYYSNHILEDDDDTFIFDPNLGDEE